MGAVPEIRIKDRWDAINAETEAREAAKLEGRKYTAERLENGDTPKELLARGRYALFKSPEKWTAPQRAQRWNAVRSVPRFGTCLLAVVKPQGDIQQTFHQRLRTPESGPLVQPCGRLRLQIIQHHCRHFIMNTPMKYSISLTIALQPLLPNQLTQESRLSELNFME